MSYKAEILHSGHQFEIYLADTGKLNEWREGGLHIITKGYSKEILNDALGFLVEPIRSYLVHRAYESAIKYLEEKEVDITTTDRYHFRLYNF
jgi:hypothetical protein